MSAPQQGSTPTPPPATAQTPQAPQAPAPVTGGGTMTPQQREQLKTDIRKAVQDAAANAKEAARLAREARADAARAQSSSTPVVDFSGGTLQPPMDPVMIKNMAENISNAFFITVAVIAIGVPLVRALGRRLGPAPAAVQIPPQMTQQLERIEQAVEAMAIEVERISESQRFLTKLQSGNAEPAALPRPGGGARG